MYEEELTYKIRGAVFEVYRQLGHGFLETVYHKALAYELTQQGLAVKSEVPLIALYKNHEVGQYRADLIVEGKILLELKAQTTLNPASEAQVINYLKITGLKLGLLINFNWPKATVKRLVHNHH
ncbi:GxxExxY protein [Oceanisphaera pacifica]|uniref:GxxExxY protein n=1 Tax=Oceanisphaera pacifica TaxID=2818389 RepID=A0ABS3NHE8_9GAMM|nr:GxxExxY protein [Oceanisphaera pacifica]MBO1519737.1 GxxExxY protein [Oceanisphaera pacifica]